MNELLSQIVAEIFEKSKGGEELSSRIRRLRVEIKKVIESEDTIFGKFRGLVESFREIIPEEKQRYHAAMKALSTTSKLSRQEIVKAVNDQLKELKILEKGLVPALPGWRDELKAMEAKSLEMRGEITKLRERILWLENEEKRIRNTMSTREREMELVENAMRELFADIETEITSIKKKVDDMTVEGATAQPIPYQDPIKRDVPGGKQAGGEQKSEIKESFAMPQDTEFQKKCPMCGGRMNLHVQEDLWMCYSCAYEEKKREVWTKNEVKNEPKKAPQSVSASDSIFAPSPSFGVPLVSLSSEEKQEPIKGSIQRPGSAPSNKQQPTKKKTCPSCRKKMNWYPLEKAWRCPFCDYERRI